MFNDCLVHPQQFSLQALPCFFQVVFQCNTMVVCGFLQVLWCLCTCGGCQCSVTLQLTCFVFSSLSGHAPPYLADDIHLVSEGPRRRLRSSTDRSCAVPRTNNTFGDRSFAVAGPRVWNSLPAHLRDEDITDNSFRRELKMFLADCT